MKYTAGAILGRNSVPKLLGSYECELHEIIESALRSNHHRVIDVGSAEGYYAVGFALKRGCHVVAFDTDPQNLCNVEGSLDSTLSGTSLRPAIGAHRKCCVFWLQTSLASS